MAEENSKENKDSNPNEIFFNVPPKGRMQGPLIEQKITVTQTDDPADALHEPDFRDQLKKYKSLLFATIGIILVFTVAGYFVYAYFIAYEPNTEQIQVASPTIKAPATDSNLPSPVVSQISTDWIQRYFKDTKCEPSLCADASDPDRDNLTNLEEFKLGTDPNNNDSDTDGMADGDEIKIFDSSPLQSHTSGNAKYSDADDAKGGFDVRTPGKKFTDIRFNEVKSKMREAGLHQPTIATLGDSLLNLYGITPLGTVRTTDPNAPPDPLVGLDVSPEAVLDRDTERRATIKKLGIALVKYKNSSSAYPITESFAEMTTKIKPYNLVATNAQDPVNKEPYVYTYETEPAGKSFTLIYYSESQKTSIKYTSTQAEADFKTEDSTLRDEQRMQDLESIKSALMAYSGTKVGGSVNFVFPPVSKYKSELVPKFLTTMPKDPKTASEYEYQVSPNFDSFTLRTILESPSAGTSGYLCNQEECRKY